MQGQTVKFTSNFSYWKTALYTTVTKSTTLSYTLESRIENIDEKAPITIISSEAPQDYFIEGILFSFGWVVFILIILTLMIFVWKKIHS